MLSGVNTPGGAPAGKGAGAVIEVTDQTFEQEVLARWEVYRSWTSNGWRYGFAAACPKLHHQNRRRCIFCGAAGVAE